MSIDEIISKCTEQGFKASKSNNWIWINGSDGRYSKYAEGKLLEELGFKYAKKRNKYYYIVENTYGCDRLDKVMKVYNSRNSQR
ncbi:hypothetical protein QH639_19365 [Lysinibacillus sp. 1 U-2021]|uniref:hypothetical protein n=1 Tax=Lysinibacillus sp. 1 U-2021 TaxID=3039426 RepID=UPI0024807977|nr:hypothetical protein [Lysinibacillus sp. 1 U-2021]WGT37963.1 hypothetical protein QH639_19365 [Lysinibacillus sp. 1 U-2021]